MKIKGYIMLAGVLIFFVFLIYFSWFYFVVDVKVSKDPADWGQLGSYAGGVLGPLLSFVSIVLLIKSLTLQHEANASLKDDIKNNEKIEKLRSFEILFFNLIGSQKSLFDSFKIDAVNVRGVRECLVGAKAVIWIEEKVEAIRSSGGLDEEVMEYIDSIDDSDQIFGLLRAFYVAVMIVSDKLSDEEGFSSEDRVVHFKALINLTDFAQLRIVMMCVQFMEYESVKYLQLSHEFKNVAEDLGLSYELY